MRRDLIVSAAMIAAGFVVISAMIYGLYLLGEPQAVWLVCDILERCE